MKKVLLSIILIFIFQESIGQNLPTYAPVSPNAASLGKFGAFPVNTNLGTTNISIPLYTVKQGDITIPISLSYNATSGIRVNEEASWVGLGWTLNAGGAIVRSVKGQPSTNDIPDLGSLDFNLTNYNYMLNVAKGWADSAQDEYLFNYSGVSGKFLYDQNKQNFVFTDYKPIKVTASNGFNAVLQNGLKLGFNDFETTDKWLNTQLPQWYKQYTSAYYLTTVTSSNQTDIVSFEYDTTEISKPVEVYGDSGGSNVGLGAVGSVSVSPNYSGAVKLNEKILKRINFINGYIIFESSLDRADSDSAKLNHIKVYSLINGVSTLVKQVTFNYDYYTRSGGETYRSNVLNYPNKYNRTLKLTHVDTYSNNDSPQSYLFEYNSTILPIRNSSGQDFWGYANNNNGSYVHKRDATFYHIMPYGGDWLWEKSVGSTSLEIGTGNRNADEGKMKAGILTKITYPTGGHTEFEYEANKFEKVVSVPTYTHHSRTIISEGTGGFGACDTGLKTLTFSPTTTSTNAKLKITFTDALAGNGNQSYGEFNGQKYYRSPPTTLYPYTTYNIDISLSQSNNYTIKAMEYGDGAPGASGCPFVSVNVTWDEFTGSTSQTVEELVGGLRIKSIRSYDGTNTAFASKKEFEYTIPTVLTPITDGDYQTLKWNGSGGYTNNISSSPTYSLNVNGGPAIEYNKVTEYNKDNVGNDNGKIVYEYEPTPVDRIIGNGTQGSGSQFTMFVNPNYYGGSCDAIPLSVPTTESSVINNLRTRGYGNFSSYQTKSWASGSLKKQEFFKRNTNGSYSKLKTVENNYTLVDETTIHLNYIHDVIPWVAQSPQAGFEDHCSFYNFLFMYKKGSYTFGKKLLTSAKETQYDDNGLNPVITEQIFSYNNPSYFLTEQTVKDSANDILRTETVYPEDIVSPVAPVQKLVNLHRISEPIEVKTYKKVGTDPEKQLSHQKTEYKEWYTDGIFPEFIKTSKGSQSLEDRIIYHDYDDKGNPIEISKKDGTNIYYVLGYQQTQPIAKIEGYTASELTAVLSKINTAIAASNNDTNATTENTLRTALEAIRNDSNMATSQVTTFTYDPLIGVTSITDPRGQTIYYEYDAFNRLEFVKNAQGEILSNNQYNYKN